MTNPRSLRVAAIAATLVAFTGGASLAASATSPVGPETAPAASTTLRWSALATDTTGKALPFDPISESRILAIVHLAIHDAANAAVPRYRTYGPDRPEARGANVDAAIAGAAHAALTGEHVLEQHVAELSPALDRDLLGAQVGEAQLLQQLNRRNLADVGLEEVGGDHGDGGSIMPSDEAEPNLWSTGETLRFLCLTEVAF